MGLRIEQFRSLLKEAAFRLSEPEYFNQRQDAWQQSVVLCSILAESTMQLPPEHYSAGINEAITLIQQLSNLSPHADVLMLDEKPPLWYLQWFASNVTVDRLGKMERSSYEREKRNGLVWQFNMDGIYGICNRKVGAMEYSVIISKSEGFVRERGMIIRLEDESVSKGSSIPQGLGLYPPFLAQDGVKKVELEGNNNLLHILTGSEWYTFYKIGNVEGDGIYFTRLSENKGKPKKIKTTSVRSSKKPSYTPGVMPV